ncbi:2-dehydro-3-deoxy-6-phosphogalactonate aldolase [Novosphingobium sp. TH158]|nr:2-dehydro-3-deoxy-6-phosphogalactonate aldolase [Novosphingobium sp. TH158]PLK27762.1 2-dehydro-3-deoxy-6-phosphogalactonate aldolase [Novosphingobium sp. TH158]
MDRLGECPIIAILRGLTPQEALPIGNALVETGIRVIEVPLNAPRALDSIEILAKEFGAAAVIGAGTVLEPADVARIAAAGGELVVSPCVDEQVIAATGKAGMVSCPGYFTPTEGLRAIAAGAHLLKLFPAQAAGPAMLKAQLEIFPPGFPVLAVGGVTPADMPAYLAAGARGFGLGSSLYRPGATPAEVSASARAFVTGLERDR